MRMLTEINQAIAGIKKAQGFSFSFIFTLAITLGVLTAAFNLNQLLQFSSLPYPEAEKLYLLKQNQLIQGKQNKGGQLVGAQFLAFQEAKDFSQSALIAQDRGILVSNPNQPVLISLYTTYEYFELLGIKFELGKGFSQAQRPEEAKSETVISYQLWQELFNADPDIIGQSIEFQDHQFTIVGVTNEKYFEPDSFALYGKSQLILPIAFSRFNANDWRNVPRNLFSLIKPFAHDGLAEVQQRLDQIIQQGIVDSSAAPNYQNIQVVADLIPLSDSITGDNTKTSLLIFAGTIVLLLIAFSNLVNLYLSHCIKRQRELAICASVGATPGDIFKRLFTESMILTFSASLIALLVSSWLIIFIKQLAKGMLPRLEELSLSAEAIIFCLLVSLGLAALLALFGAKTVSYNKLKNQLSSSGKGTSTQISQSVRRILIGSQICLTSLLLLSTSMVFNNSLQIAHRPIGVDIDQVISFQLDPGEKYKTQTQRHQVVEQVKQHFTMLPQIQAVSKNMIAPIRVGNFSTPLVNLENQVKGIFGFSFIDEDYFDLLSQPLIKGRNLTREEVEEAQAVAVISESVAKSIFGDNNAVGENIYMNVNNPVKVIGITRDHFNPFTFRSYQGNIYMPMRTFRLNLLLKVKPGASLKKTEVLHQLQSIDPSLRILEYLELANTKEALVYQYRLSAWLAGGLSLFAIILACTGIYGVLSYSTQMRRFELGIRIALGANKSRIRKLVMIDTIKPLVSGMILSLLLGVAIYTGIKEQIMLFGQPNALQVVFCSILLLIFSLLACILPVNKVLKEDPIIALRND